MKALDFKGIIPPVLSSFTPDGEIYEKGIREVIRFTLPHVDAYYPIGTYGCGPLMSLEERKKALEIILDEVNAEVPVIAHVGAADTKSTLELAKHAKKAGASAVGAISPYYAPNLPDEALYSYFASLVDAVAEDEFPVFLYNNPHYSQNIISPKLLRRMANHGLRGCKDSSFDLVNFYQYQDAVADYPDFNVIVGTEAIFVAAFDAGATGCVCGMGNIYPELMARMYKEYESGEREKALETQRLILKIRSITKVGPTMPNMYAILEIRGIDAGYPRQPYLPVDDARKAEIKVSLAKLNLL
ncbi:MAG TPA: dihydrodipicolinate synthase family protein [Corynebacteriales bacterium]|nr:dihydrodipicolinate synthase family protein [Mycobacteriales bacterium]